MKDYLKLVDECKADFDALGISYGNVRAWTVNSRAKRRLGQCRKIAPGVFEISISAALLDDSISDQAVKDVIAHELLHTVPDCFNHQGRWKVLAAKISRELPHYTLKRTTSTEEVGLPPQTANYVLQCTSCGVKAERLRQSNFVQHPERYRCSVCGGKFKRVK